ncbi:phospholipase A [Psychromonas ossibalaenae]|uniref:phospholipase A n=1 Tax=Psychromonas ossibalaenae TaxID=444922 RepID=UPI000379A200|nr:phospholipase A [Psychromonas ossibalaenae]
MRFIDTFIYTFIAIAVAGAVIIFSISACLASESLIDLRLAEEIEVNHSRFALIPHKPTYILPFVFNDKIQQYSSYESAQNSDYNDFQQLEVKFQISFKMPLLIEPADLPLAVFFAYTQVSYWQAYNSEQSSPFRETNYEPEVFALWRFDKEIAADWKIKLASAGFVHQSNGQREPASRSWNRIESNFLLEKEDLVIALTSWYRLKEDYESDDNPDLLDYYGHGEINAVYHIENNTFSLVSRNNIESGFSRGSIQFSWNFPIHKKLHGYVQLFSGYGNSLIEYNQYTNTIGLGISLTDWL